MPTCYDKLFLRIPALISSRRGRKTEQNESALLFVGIIVQFWSQKIIKGLAKLECSWSSTIDKSLIYHRLLPEITVSPEGTCMGQSFPVPAHVFCVFSGTFHGGFLCLFWLEFLSQPKIFSLPFLLGLCDSYYSMSNLQQDFSGPSQHHPPDSPEPPSQRPPEASDLRIMEEPSGNSPDAT